MKYHFLIITSSYPTITGESFEGACIETFAQSLARLGNHVTILTQCVRKKYYKDSEYLTVKRFTWSKHVKPLSTLSIKHDFGKIWLYFSRGFITSSQVIKHQKVDFVICAWAIPSGLFGLYLKKYYGVPYVVWALGSDIWSHSTSLLSRYILRGVLNHAFSIYADGLSLIEAIDTLTKTKATFLPTSRILPKIPSSDVILNTDRTHFLFVGRYHVNKGPDILIEAIRLLPPHLQQKSYFHFFGLGDLYRDLKSMIHQHNLSHCISLNGPINNYKLSQYLELVDFIVIPSRIESIPVILSDALQKQCPIIATNVGDMGRLLTQHPIGYLAQRADPHSLAAMLSEALLTKYVANDRMQALYSMFDPDVNARNFLKDLERSSQLHHTIRECDKGTFGNSYTPRSRC